MLDLNTGILKIRFSETIRFDQASDVDLYKIHLFNETGLSCTLGGAVSIVAIEDDTAVQIQLNETQRVFAIESSEQLASGGDGVALPWSV